MSNRPGTHREPLSIARREAASAGSVIALASIAPIVLGTLTMETGMSPVPFNASVGLAVVLWVTAVCRYYSAMLIEHMEELYKTETKQVKKLRTKLEKDSRQSSIDELSRSFREAELRALRSVD